MSEQSSHRSSPAYAPSSSGEPDWTTGQGIGFLVALPGWILVGLSAVLLVVGAAVTRTNQIGDTSLASIALLLSTGGLISAIPGTIVFYKCKRR